jgi:hypothetical protein
MSETLHHTALSRLTGYSKRAIAQMVKDGVIECVRDRFSLPRFDKRIVEQLIERAARFKSNGAAGRKRGPP